MTGWMCRFLYGSVSLGEVEVVKRTAKQAKLAKRCEASNYANTVSMEDVHPTKIAALKAIEPRVRSHIAAQRLGADNLEQELNALLESAL